MVYGARLESAYAETHRGFESHSLRRLLMVSPFRGLNDRIEDFDGFPLLRECGSLVFAGLFGAEGWVLDNAECVAEGV